MGQGQNQHSHPVLDSNWVVVDRQNQTLFSNVNPYSKRTLHNTSNNEEVQQYELQFVSEYDFRHYTQELRIRIEPSKQQVIQQSNSDSYFHLSPYIYTVKYFVNNTLQDLCSTIYKGLLYAQKVDLRLKEINDIPLSDQLYLIKATLEGFKLLYEKVGYFDISEEMIFITKEGKVKVWINSNLSKNEPLFIPYSAYRQSHGSQSDMLVQLLDMIQQNSDSQQHQEGIHFREYLIQKNIYNRLSFHRALDEFEAYCMEEHHTIDASMRSIYQLYHPDQPQHSEVQEMSLRNNHRLPVQEKESQVKVRNQMSPIHKNTFSNLQFGSKNQESKAQLLGSRVSKRSEKQPRHTSQQFNNEDLYRPRSTNNSYIHKMKQQEFKPLNGSIFNTLQLQNFAHFPNNQNESSNLRDQPTFRREAPFQIPRQVSPPPLPRRPESVPIGKEFGLQSQHSKPAVIKFNYLPNNSVFNSRNQRETAKIIQTPKKEEREPIIPTQTFKPVEPFRPLESFKQVEALRQVEPFGHFEELQVLERFKPKEMQRLKLPPNLITIHSIQTEDFASGKELKSFVNESQSQKRQPSGINYYSSDHTYTLDKEIADDLQTFLGYSLNS